MRSAEIAGKNYRASNGWRRKNAVGAQSADALAARLPLLGSDPPCIVRCKLFWHKERRKNRKSLCERQRLSWSSSLWDGALFDGKKRLAGYPIKDEHVAHLGYHRHRRYFQTSTIN